MPGLFRPRIHTKPAPAGLLALLVFTALVLPASDFEGATATLTLPGAAPGNHPSDSHWKPADEPGLMWQVTLGRNTVYLVGSLHAASPDLYPLPPSIESAFRRSSVLLVESDLNRRTERQKRLLAAAYALYPPGDSLWNHLSPDVRTAVETAYCVTPQACEAVAHLRPWILAFLESGGPSTLRADLGIDQHFLNAAAGRMPVEELESLEGVLRKMSALPESAQEDLLLTSIRAARFEAQYDREVETAWRRGDALQMESLMNWAFRGSPEAEQTLLGDRNTHMADVLERYLRAGTPVFAVMGAFHLVGPDGVVRQLQARGYRVEQVLIAAD